MPKKRKKLTKSSLMREKARLRKVFSTPTKAVKVKIPRGSLISIQRGGVRTTIIRRRIKKKR